MLRIAITDGTLARRSVQIGTEAAIAGLLRSVGALAGAAEHSPHTPVDFLLLRERDLAPGILLATARHLVRAMATTPVRLLLAGDPAQALAVGAAGVHLAAGGNVAQAREQMPSGFLTISCHTLDEVRAARDLGASAILFAPVFGKVVDGTQVVPAAGLERLREACLLAAPVQVLALGGVTNGNTASALAAGAAGIAAIRLFFPEP
jgi:thiamine-phosphate pyrophosphorylase